MSVLGNAKSKSHRKTYEVEPGDTARKFTHLTRGDLPCESRGEVSRGRSSEESRGNPEGAKGRRTKRQANRQTRSLSVELFEMRWERQLRPLPTRWRRTVLLDTGWNSSGGSKFNAGTETLADSKVQPPDAENRTSGGVGGVAGAIPPPPPDPGSGFDRLRLRGTLRMLFDPKVFEVYLGRCDILIKNFGKFAEKLTRRVRDAAYESFEHGGRPIQYLRSPEISKEDLAREIARRDGIQEGRIALFAAVEPCLSYQVRGQRETKEIHMALETRRCILTGRRHSMPCLRKRTRFTGRLRARWPISVTIGAPLRASMPPICSSKAPKISPSFIRTWFITRSAALAVPTCSVFWARKWKQKAAG